MKRFVAFCLIITWLALSGCVNKNDDNVSVIGGANGPTSIYLNASDDTGNNFTQIDQETAKLMMELDDGHVIVDVRREDEFAEGHIPEAILIPNESIGTEQPTELPDLEQIILVYCRSGRRSKEASQKLADIGYTNVYEFGGIIDWTGEIVTDEAAEKTEEVVSMKLKIDSIEVPVTWEDNDSVDALKNLSPLTVEMSMYGGFEQVGSIGKSIVKDDKQTTTDYGDIVLYSGNQIVIFYGSNSWAYTRLGHIDMSQEELTELLGSKDVTVTLE
ncbi:cyclophilin-like fold protein [Butyrivibrio sp. JL13D10]|uniref:cyclophilin-like fold protein n=1 Tax=Butyrivibrio sp. JL13D10 TaxID=3236815 RepID=UPI0038B4EEA0